MPWGVVLLNDDFNTSATACYALHRVLGMAPAEVDPLIALLRDEGQAGVLTSEDRELAERAALKLRVFGLRARVAAVAGD